MTLKNVVFCVCSLGIAFFLARIGFEHAALPLEVVNAAHAPQSAEIFDLVDVEDFGEVSVLDMVDYYMENPPRENTVSEQTKSVRFQGC